MAAIGVVHGAPVIVYQPGTVVVDPFRTMNNQWKSGFCNICDDFGRCCYAWFCRSCFMIDLTKKIDESMLSCLCVPNVLAVYRMKVRTAYKIKGDSCSDQCAAACCGLCVALQIDSELRAHGI